MKKLEIVHTYKTSDGRLHENKEAAHTAQLIIDIAAVIEKNGSHIVGIGAAANNAARVIVASWNDIQEAAKPYRKILKAA